MRRISPALWDEVRQAGIARAAVFGWPAKRVQGLSFSGYRYTPCATLHGPLLWIDRQVSSLTFPDEAEVWRGVPLKYLQLGGPNNREVYWARPHTADPAGLGVRLQLALACWGVSPPPPPGSEGDRVLGRLLTVAAAQVGDIVGMEEACREHGVDEPVEYAPTLWAAATRGEVDCVRALVRLVGEEVTREVYSVCKGAAVGHPLPRDTRREIASYVMADIPVPEWYRADVAEALAQHFVDPVENRRAAIKGQPKRRLI